MDILELKKSHPRKRPQKPIEFWDAEDLNFLDSEITDGDCQSHTRGTLRPQRSAKFLSNNQKSKY